MSNEEIIDLYDQHPDMTLAQLARMTGRTIAELKALLQE